MKFTFPPSRHDLLVSLGFLIVVALLAGAIWYAWDHYIKTAPYVDQDVYPVRGIDISAHNGDIDMVKVRKEGIEFVFIKASEGVDFRDSRFLENYTKARRAGMKIGVYHFFRFDRNGIDQARNLIGAIGRRHLDLGVAIDVEDHGNAKGVDSLSIAKRLTEMVEFLNLAGYRVTFYSNRDGYPDYLRQTVPGAPLWICSFTPMPADMEWTFWQYDHRGKVNGIEGYVDLNAFCGSREDWERYLNGAIWPYRKDLYPTKQNSGTKDTVTIDDTVPKTKTPPREIIYQVPDVPDSLLIAEPDDSSSICNNY